MAKYKDTDIPIVEGKCVTKDWPVTSSGVIEAFSDGVLTVDKMLDYADLALDWYIPSNDAIEFILFIRLVLGEEPENNNPKAHYFLMDCIFGNDNVKPFYDARGIPFEELKDRVVVLCTREFAKSVMVVYLILYMAAKGTFPNFGKVYYGIYVSDSMRNNVETTMTTIAKVYRESKYLRNLFEETRLIQTEVNFIRKPSTKKEIAQYHQHVVIEKQAVSTVPGRMKRTLTVTGLGAATGGRGSRDGLARPDWAIFDDMVPSEKEAESEVVLDNIESTIESDILKALSGNGNFAVAFGTPYNKKDPIYRRIEEGSWLPVVFPRALKFDETTTEENFVSVWPDRHTYKQCRKDYMVAKRAEDRGNKMPMRKLLQENYLRISNEEDRMISDRMIQWYSRQDIEKHISAYNIYITTDLTTTGSDGSDYSGIAAWAVGSNSDYFLLDLNLKKLELEEQYNEIFRMVKYYANLTGRGITVGIEIDGQQKTHIFALKDRMVSKNEWFTFGRGKGSKIDSEGILSRLEGGNKHWRFRMMLPQWQNHKIWFPRELKDSPDMYEMLEELKYVTYNGFGCLSGDTLIDTPEGQKRIIDIEHGDNVYSQSGDSLQVLKAYYPTITGIEETYTVTTEDSVMYLTKSHKVLTMRGYVKVCDLNSTDLVIKGTICKSKCMDTSGQTVEKGITSPQHLSGVSEDGFIELYGKQKKVPFLSRWKSIIKMKTNITINYLTLKYYQQRLTNLNMWEEKHTGITETIDETVTKKEELQKQLQSKQHEYVYTVVKDLNLKRLLKMAQSIVQNIVNSVIGAYHLLLVNVLYALLPSSKKPQIKSAVDKSVIEYVKSNYEKKKKSIESAESVEIHLQQSNLTKASIVQLNVEVLQKIDLQSRKSAENVEKTLWLNLLKLSPAQISANVSTLKSIEKRKIEPVYDFEVKGTHNYVANGIVTHNSLHDDGCDLISQLGSMEIMFPMRNRDEDDNWNNKKRRNTEGIWSSEESIERSAFDNY